MHSRWAQAEADGFVDRYAGRWGDVLAVRTYSARLLGAEPSLVLHGGGNTSVKGLHRTIVGDERPALYVKASGADMAEHQPTKNATFTKRRGVKSSSREKASKPEQDAGAEQQREQRLNLGRARQHRIERRPRRRGPR